MKARKPLVAGNWKMNGGTLANEHLFTGLRASIDRHLMSQVELLVCPPFPYLGQAAAWLGDTDIAWGAQNVASLESGAFTGEVSAAMLEDLGCKWTIVGHSERRTLLGEEDETIARKAEIALAHKLSVIYCIGETLDERERDITEEVLRQQIERAAPVIAGTTAERMVIAYEPVWAIGTGRSATPEQAQTVHEFIRTTLGAMGVQHARQIRIVYGGSVKAANALALFSMPDIDGGLIGGASLVADEFVGICRAAALG